MHELTPAEVLTLETYDREAATWSSGHMTKGFWADEMAAFHQRLPRGRVLEIGSGGGRDARALRRYGYDYVGTDISGGLIAQARLHNPGVVFRQQSAYDLDFENEFDGFWCSAMLLHIPRERIHEPIERIGRACKPAAIGFIAIKEGSGETIQQDEFGDRFFTFWQDEAFREVLGTHGMGVLESVYRPMSERTKWLTYIVEVNK